MPSSGRNITKEQDELLTAKAYALSLSPPRAPPIGSVHYHVLLGMKDPIIDLGLQRQVGGQRRQQQHLQHPDGVQLIALPHPQLPVRLEINQRITRFLGVVLPLSWQHNCRDSGLFRFIIDTLVSITAVPIMTLTVPNAARNFISLSKQKQVHRYGPHALQTLDLYLPEVPSFHIDQKTDSNTNNTSSTNNSTKSTGTTSNERPCRLVFFVHGGAWGSGLPWMYRLVAQPFLQQGYVVAIAGYRTYPDGCVKEQIQDCRDALEKTVEELVQQKIWPMDGGPITVIGHSSGAHIALLMLVDRLTTTAKETTSIGPNQDIDCFVGLSGPYNISHHFDYEASRGVEELSPMKPVNGYTRQSFRIYSPALRLQDVLANNIEQTKGIHVDQGSSRNLPELSPRRQGAPRIVLIHGIEDETVPFTATSEAARILRSCGLVDESDGKHDAHNNTLFRWCEEIYLARTSHQDTVLHLMMGGSTLDVVLDWMKQVDCTRIGKVQSTRILATSRL